MKHLLSGILTGIFFAFGFIFILQSFYGIGLILGTAPNNLPVWLLVCFPVLGFIFGFCESTFNIEEESK
ncbi:MAG: hypothetical protein WC758_07665 [Candidatus Woesearchaeota archaeon]|jgi:hypothetical protein